MIGWKPESFTAEQRYAASKSIVHAQVAVCRLDCFEFGPDNADLLKKVYLRIDDLLSMILEDLAGMEGTEPQRP